MRTSRSNRHFMAGIAEGEGAAGTDPVLSKIPAKRPIEGPQGGARPAPSGAGGSSKATLRPRATLGGPVAGASSTGGSPNPIRDRFASAVAEPGSPGPLETLEGWVKRYASVLDPAGKPRVLFSYLVEGLAKGIPWVDIFPDGNERAWPSAASLRRVVFERLRHDSSAFGALGIDEVEGLDRKQAMGLLESLKDADGRLQLELPELFALPAACCDDFLLRVSNNPLAKGQLRQFLDFVKAELMSHDETLRYDKRTTIGPKALVVFNGVATLRYDDSTELTKRLASKDGKLSGHDANSINMIHLFERHVSAFDPSPIGAIVDAARPHAWTEAQGIRGWVDRADELGSARACELLGKSDLSKKQREVVTRIFRTAIEVRTEQSLARSWGPPVRRFRSSRLQDLMAVFDVGRSGTQVQVGRRLLHLLEAANPASDDALQDLLAAAKPMRRDANLSADAYQVLWADRAVAAWRDVATAPGLERHVEPDRFDAENFGSYLQPVVHFALQTWFDGVARPMGRPRGITVRNADVVRWHEAFLNRHPGGQGANEVRKLMMAFDVATVEGANDLRYAAMSLRPGIGRPSDALGQQRWVQPWREAVVARLLGRTKLDGAAHVLALGRFVDAAIGVDLVGAAEAVTRVQPTRHRETSGWLRTLAASTTPGDSTFTTAKALVKRLELGEAEEEHRLRDILVQSRPADRPQSDIASWNQRWTIAARARLDPVVLATSAGPARELTTLGSVSGAAFDRLIAVAIDDLDASIGPGPAASRDHLFPFRDPLHPERVYAPFAAADGGFHPAARIRGVTYPLSGGRQIPIAGMLADKARRGMSDAQAGFFADRMRDDVSSLLDRLRRQEPRRPDGSPWAERTHQRLLTAADLPAHQHALVGQRGLFMRPPTKTEPRAFTAQWGYVAGLYMGGVIRSEKGEALVLPADETQDRALTVTLRDGATITFCGTRFGNSTSLANVALAEDPAHPGRPSPRLDEKTTNADLVPFVVKALDNRGEPHETAVVALVVYDKIFDQTPNEHGDFQVWADLGVTFTRRTLAPLLGLQVPSEWGSGSEPESESAAPVGRESSRDSDDDPEWVP